MHGAASSHATSDQYVTALHGHQIDVESADMKGERKTMEDVSLINLSAHRLLVGIFDGHGGATAPNYLATELAQVIRGYTTPEQITTLIARLDEAYCAEHSRSDGSCALFAVIEPPCSAEWNVTLCHIGDSRAILFRADGSYTLLTTDHHPNVPSEAARIQAAGARVYRNYICTQRGANEYRLALSRSFGDRHFKCVTGLPLDMQPVVVEPDIVVFKAQSGDILLLCCDGIFENLSVADVVQFVKRELQVSTQNDTLCAKLNRHSLQMGSRDNHTSMMLTFGRSVILP